MSKSSATVFILPNGHRLIMPDCFLRMAESRWWDQRKWYDYDHIPDEWRNAMREAPQTVRSKPYSN